VFPYEGEESEEETLNKYHIPSLQGDDTDTYKDKKKRLLFQRPERLIQKENKLCFPMRERRVRRRLENKYHIPSLQGDNTRKNNRGTVLRYCSERS